MITAILEEIFSVELARCYSAKGRSRKGNGKKSFCNLRLYSYMKGEVTKYAVSLQVHTDQLFHFKLMWNYPHYSVAIQKEFPEIPDKHIERKVGRWLTEMEDPRKDKKIEEQNMKKNFA